jgi:hypothetical protein
MSFPLFTSIKPPVTAVDLSYLRDCLASWRAAGFDPVAVNGPGEIGKLRDFDLPVEFSSLPTDGKPRIGDLLSAIRESGAPFAGIINSDCKIVAYPGNIAMRLADGLAGRAVVAWRLDIGGEAEASAEPDGFDAFLFDTAHIPAADGGFSIGDVFWDSWFPVALAAAGAQIGRLDLPLITHRRHPATWDQAKWYAGAQRGWAAFRAIRKNMPNIGIPPAWWDLEHLSEPQLGPMGFYVCEWIRRQPPGVALLDPSLADLEATLSAAGRSLIAATLQGYVWRDKEAKRHNLIPKLLRQFHRDRLRRRWTTLKSAVGMAT